MPEKAKYHVGAVVCPCCNAEDHIANCAVRGEELYCDACDRWSPRTDWKPCKHWPDPCTETEPKAEGPRAQRSNDALRHTLVLPGFIDAIARRMTLGAEKYSDWNWQQDMPLEWIFDHLQTHLNKLRRGDLDDTTVNPPSEGIIIPNNSVRDNALAHIAAIACNTMMLWWYVSKYPKRLKEYQEKQR